MTGVSSTLSCDFWWFKSDFQCFFEVITGKSLQKKYNRSWAPVHERRSPSWVCISQKLWVMLSLVISGIQTHSRELRSTRAPIMTTVTMGLDFIMKHINIPPLTKDNVMDFPIRLDFELTKYNQWSVFCKCCRENENVIKRFDCTLEKTDSIVKCQNTVSSELPKDAYTLHTLRCEVWDIYCEHFFYRKLTLL